MITLKISRECGVLPLKIGGVATHTQCAYMWDAIPFMGSEVFLIAIAFFFRVIAIALV